MTKLRNIPVAEPDIGPLEKRYVNEVLASGWISSIGPMVTRFEREFAGFIGTKYAVAVSSGTTALDLALNVLGIGPGDEVIVPTFTFAATANAIIHQGAKPVLVDSSMGDWNLDSRCVEAAITKRTRAIIVVHVYGIPVNMKAIAAIARRHNLYIVEDAAEAHGARVGNAMVGSLGDVGCFSFFGNKIMTTGEGGMCCLNSKRLQDKMRIIMSHGSKAHGSIYYYHPFVGHNYRLTSAQAALGVAQLSRIREFLKIRSRHERWYRNFLKNTPGVSFSPKPAGVTTVDWMHSILIRHPRVTRDALISELKKRGIQTRPFFYPMHKMPPYKLYRKGSFPVSENLSRTGINLPSSTRLTRGDIARVCGAITEILKV